MTGLTTHVLDTALGSPVEGLRIDVYYVSDEQRVKLKSVVTNRDGRVEGGPILAGDEFRKGQYELVFHAGDYLRDSGASLSDLPFLDLVPIRFGISDETAHYHVPLLLSTHSYSTYRGS